jgi:hypothetical protein
MPHVIIGHYNPHEQIDEEGTGQPSYFRVLRTCQNGLSLARECTFSVDRSAATIKLSYALAEDAARVCELVGAVPARVVGDCVALAYFKYDRPLYNKLRALRDDRIGHDGPMEQVRASRCALPPSLGFRHANEGE